MDNHDHNEALVAALTNQRNRANNETAYFESELMKAQATIARLTQELADANARIEGLKKPSATEQPDNEVEDGGEAGTGA